MWTLTATVRESFWFAPLLLALAAAALAFTTVAIDRASGDPSGGSFWLYLGDHEGARALLSTVAGSVISVAGVTFSITIAVLSVASQQLGPRAIRSFVRDRGNQVALGTYVATFLYCLLVLRTVRGDAGAAFVPHLSVTVAVGLAVVSLGVLIWFIHHVAMSIQADHLVVDLSGELHRAIDALYPPRPDAPRAAEAPTERPRQVRSEANGYVRLIQADSLSKIAAEYALVLRIEARPGDFVMPGDALVSVWPETAGRTHGTSPLDDALRAAIVLGRKRSAEPVPRGARALLPALAGDIRFPVEQIVEVAVRALSPGINDPYTAMSCIDQLGSAMCALVVRDGPVAAHHDEHGALRLLADPVRFDAVAREVFGPLLAYSDGDALVREHLARTLLRLEARAPDEHRRGILREYRRQAGPG